MTLTNTLLFMTINWISSVDANATSREAARLYVNQQLTCTRTWCHLMFIETCIRYKVIPQYVDQDHRQYFT